MTTNARALLPVLTVLLVGACGSGGPEEPAPRSELVGVWDLVTVDGATLPARSPEEETVLLESISMTLTREGGYSLASSFRLNGQAPTSTTIGGTWVATDDALTFHGQQGPAVVVFGYRLDGGLLRMTDEQGHEWTMRQRR